MSKKYFIEPEKYMAVNFPRLTKEERSKIMEKRYAILLQRDVEHDMIDGGVTVSNTWYLGAGQYSYLFETCGRLRGARIFQTAREAQEELNSASFQRRLKEANYMMDSAGLLLYEPTIVEIGVIND